MDIESAWDGVGWGDSAPKDDNAIGGGQSETPGGQRRANPELTALRELRGQQPQEAPEIRQPSGTQVLANTGQRHPWELVHRGGGRASKREPPRSPPGPKDK